MVFHFHPVGLIISESNNIMVDGNVIGDILQRSWLALSPYNQDKEGGLLTCTYFSRRERCRGLQVTNNIVAGAYWVGMTLFGHECGKPKTNKFGGNVVHSIANSGGGIGAHMSPNIMVDWK